MKDLVDNIITIAFIAFAAVVVVGAIAGIGAIIGFVLAVLELLIGVLLTIYMVMLLACIFQYGFEAA